MIDKSPSDTPFHEAWLLRNLPVVTFFCADDENLTLRFLQGPGGEALGYRAGASAEGLGLVRGSVIVKEDDDVLTAMINQATVGHSPVLARLRVRAADGEVVPVLVVFQGVFSKRNGIVGFAGAGIDLRSIPPLQGESALLSEPGPKKLWTQNADPPERLDEVWLASMLPVVAYATEDDDSYTVRMVRGPLRRMLGYSPDDLIDNARYESWSTVPPEDLDLVERLMDRTRELKGQAVAARYRTITLHGKDIPVLVVGRSVAHPRGAGELVCSVAVSVENAPELLGPSTLFA